MILGRGLYTGTPTILGASVNTNTLLIHVHSGTNQMLSVMNLESEARFMTIS